MSSVILENNNGIKKDDAFEVDKGRAWYGRRVVPIALAVGVVAAVAAVIAGLLFVPGSPMAMLGSSLVGATFVKLGLSTGISIGVYSASFIGIPTAIGLLIAKKVGSAPDNENADRVEHIPVAQNRTMADTFNENADRVEHIPVAQNRTMADTFNQEILKRENLKKLHMLAAFTFKELNLDLKKSMFFRMLNLQFTNGTGINFVLDYELMKECIRQIDNEELTRETFERGDLPDFLRTFNWDGMIGPLPFIYELGRHFEAQNNDPAYFSLFYLLASRGASMDDTIKRMMSIYPVVVSALPPEKLHILRDLSAAFGNDRLNSIPEELTAKIEALRDAFNQKSFERLTLLDEATREKITRYYSENDSLQGLELNREELVLLGKPSFSLESFGSDMIKLKKALD